MHRADIVMFTNFCRAIILLLLPLFIVDVIEFLISIIKKWKFFQEK